MATELTWLGHGAWSIATASHHLLLDPFLDDSPVAPVKADDVEADFILVSHGHFDHVADVEKIAKRTGATVIGCFEVCEWFGAKGIENRHAMNIGGGSQQPFGYVKMTPAQHSSMLPDGTNGGVAAGFILAVDEGVIYFACDTGLFLDMELIGTAGLDLAILPIGDNFTMGPADAVEAVKLLRPKRVVPVHANTWPLIEQDVDAWAKQVKEQTEAEPVVLQPGDTLTLSEVA